MLLIDGYYAMPLRCRHYIDAITPLLPDIDAAIYACYCWLSAITLSLLLRHAGLRHYCRRRRYADSFADITRRFC